MSIKPDTQQRGLAGEYYVAFVISRLGYDVAMTMGRAKAFDITAIGPSGKTLKIQVKTTYIGNDWLVPRRLSSAPDAMLALVRLGKDPTRQAEVYFLSSRRANRLISDIYPTHSARIGRTRVRKEVQDHDFKLIRQLLG